MIVRRTDRRREDQRRSEDSDRERERRDKDRQREQERRNEDYDHRLELERQEREWQRQRIALERELLVAAPMDEALVQVQRLVIGRGVYPTESAYSAAHTAWDEAWLRYAPRLTNRELEARFRSVGSLLTELAIRREPNDAPTRPLILRAIGNARVALGYFLRDEELPPNGFPCSKDLCRLLGEGDGTNDQYAPLRQWMAEHPEPAWRGATALVNHGAP